MADDDIEIKIGTDADTSGLDTAQDGIDQLVVTTKDLAQIKINELAEELVLIEEKLQNAATAQQRLVAELEEVKATGTKEEVQEIASALDKANDASESLTAEHRSTQTVLESQQAVVAEIVAQKEREIATAEILKQLEEERAQRSAEVAAEFEAIEAKRQARQSERSESSNNHDAEIAQLETLTDAVNSYNEALISGDQEAAIAAVQTLKTELNAMAEEAAEIPPEFKEINAQLDKLEQEVSTKKGFKKLTEQADGAAKSLSKIEKLQVAEALGQVLGQARSAGKGLASLSDDAGTAIDKTLDAADAIGGLASSVAQGFAVGGPIGAGIALVTAGLSFFSEKSKDASEDAKAFIDTFDDLLENFDDLKNATNVDDAFDSFLDNLQRQDDQLKLNSTELEKNIQLRRDLRSIDLEELRLDLEEKKAEIANSDLGESDKVSQTADLDRQFLLAKSGDKRQTLSEELQIIAAQKSAQAAILENAKQAVQTAKEGVTQESIDAKKTQAKNLEETGKEAIAKFLEVNLQSSSVSIKNLDLKRRLKQIEETFDDSKKGKQDERELLEGVRDIFKELSTRSGGKLPNTSFARDVEEAGSLASTALSSAKNVEILNKSAIELEDLLRKQADIIDNFPAIQSEIETELRQLDREENLKKRELEFVDTNQAKQSNIRQLKTDKTLSRIAEKEAKAEATEKKKSDRKRASEKKKVESSSTKAAGSALNTLDELTGVKGATSKFKQKVSDAQSANVDGASPAEMAEIVEIINAVLNSTNKRGKVDGNILKQLQRQKAEIQNQAVMHAKLEAKVRRLGPQIKQNL